VKRVRFEGPTSLISGIRKADRAMIRIDLRKEDLLGKPRQTLEFSVERGISHSYGNEVQLLSMSPGKIRLTVAARKTVTLDVQEPVVTGIPPEWGTKPVSLALVTKRATISGPQDSVDSHDKVPVEPVNASELLRDREEDEVRLDSLTLELSRDAIAKGIKLEDPRRIVFQAEFRRSRAEAPVQLPLRVYYEEPRWPVVLDVPERAPLVERKNGDLWIRLEFRGSPTDLANLEELADKGGAWAWIDANDLAEYRAKKTATLVRVSQVHLTVIYDPADVKAREYAGLAGRVSFRPVEVEVNVTKEE
jgi:hypothetical protein